MSEILKICLIQVDITWEDKKKNMLKYSDIFRKLKDSPELIVLPEMFLTGFTMNYIEMAEDMEGETISWMRKMAGQYNSVITGSLIYTENQKVYNRLIWMKPSGDCEYYDKRHLFTMGGEKEIFSPGNKHLIVDLNGWRICPLICYDLRFPVWSRNTGNYDLLLYCANWPAIRQSVWDTLLTARALENQCFVCGINRIGTDGNDIKYSGGSRIIDPKGKKIVEMGKNRECSVISGISINELREFQNAFPVLKDRDEFQIRY